MQQEMFDANGFIARVDFVYPLAKLILEADSFKYHGGREDWENDSGKRARLTALGYRVLPITWRMLTTDPNAVQNLIRHALRTTSP